MYIHVYVLPLRGLRRAVPGGHILNSYVDRQGNGFVMYLYMWAEALNQLNHSKTTQLAVLHLTLFKDLNNL